MMLNAEELEAKVREVAHEYPDTVYQEGHNPSGQKCLYRATELNPRGCIIGEAARRLGQSLDGRYSSVALLSKYETITGDAAWLCMVQTEQDSGASWRDAVDAADNLRDFEKFDHPVELSRMGKVKAFFTRKK